MPFKLSGKMKLLLERSRSGMKPLFDGPNLGLSKVQRLLVDHGLLDQAGKITPAGERVLADAERLRK